MRVTNLTLILVQERLLSTKLPLSFFRIQKQQQEFLIMKEPHKNLRLTWAIILGVLPAVLVLYSDHSVALDLILIASLPLLFVYPLMALSIIKELRK